jgi:hypothetical protein
MNPYVCPWCNQYTNLCQCTPLGVDPERVEAWRAESKSYNLTLGHGDTLLLTKPNRLIRRAQAAILRGKK